MRRWWLATPHRDSLHACFGALGIGLARRFELWLRALQLRAGLPAAAASAPPAQAAAADGCDFFRQQASAAGSRERAG